MKKKLDRALSKDYPPLIVYRDDLEEIEQEIKDARAPEDNEGLSKFLPPYAVECGESSYDSVAELPQDSRVREVKIEGWRPRVSVELGRGVAKLYVGSSGNESAGLFHKLDVIMTRCRRTVFRWTSIYVFGAAMLIGVLSYALRGPAQIVAVSIQLLLLAYGTLMSCFDIWRHSNIVLHGRRGALGFFQRKGDDLRLSFVSAVVGAILGVAGTLIVQWLTSR
jgi:hypothetical protein